MPEAVWVADWEMQCCGDPFAVGDVVEWALTSGTDDWLDRMFGDRPIPRITSYYDRHSESPPPPIVKGVVRSIQAVRFSYKKRGRVHLPIEGSATVADRATATGWEDKAYGAGDRFVGYVVQLDPTP